MLKTFFKSKIWPFITAIIAVILIFVFVPTFALGVKNLSSRILLAPVKAYTGLIQYFQSKRALVKNNRALQEKLARLSLEAEKYKDLKRENDRLRDLLKFKGGFGFDTLSAEIIARNPSDWVGSILINRGSADGVKKNSAICSAKGLLGKIIEVDSNISSAILITNPNFKTGGVVRESRINGIVVGAGKGEVRMLYIPMDADVKEGSTVVTSELSRIFPKGIGIGQIVSVRRSRTGLYKYAVIKPFADPFDQEEVLCIK
ncbi:MAG: rod shape-determining protein MreC [Candidatus Omnitrophota bacterium]